MTLIITAILISAAAGLAFSGTWRFGLRLFAIRPARMTCHRLGLRVPEEHQSRVDGILQSFAGGFNRMLTARSETAAQAYCDSLAPLFQPFAQEGAAMGYRMRHLGPFNPGHFEQHLVGRREEFCYLYYVGLGFWAGMRNYSPEAVGVMVHKLDPLHSWLCYDGYGFKVAFFDHVRNPSAFRHLHRFEGYARNAAFQGVGRALVFRYLGAPDQLRTQLKALGEHASDVAGGVGLAAGFVFFDRLNHARRLAAEMPCPLQADVHLGLCFGLKARSVNDPELFERCLAEMDADEGEAIRQSIAACDQFERNVRASGPLDGYRRWREQVRSWMEQHIEYPLKSVVENTSNRATAELATAC